jgi:hypothetical protein
MSKVTIAGDVNGTGVFTIASPNGNTNRTLTLPDAAGTLALQGGTGVGKVLQVVSATTSIVVSTTSTAYVATNLTVSITPTSASSKVLVFAICPTQTSSAAGGGLSLYRGATKIFDPSAADGSNTNFYLLYGLAGGYIPLQVQHLDTPASVNPVTYTIYMASYNGGTVRMPFSGSVVTATANIVLMEIAT